MGTDPPGTQAGTGLAGDRKGAIGYYRNAAGRTTNLPERNYLLTQAARLAEEDQAGD